MRLKELLKQYKSLDDKVVAVLYETGFNKIPTDMKALHSVFYQICQEHADFFSDMHFKIGGRFPYSESLDQTFPGLALSGFISILGPRYEFYIIDEEKRELIQQNILPLFSPDELTEIKEIGEKIKNLLSRYVLGGPRELVIRG